MSNLPPIVSAPPRARVTDRIGIILRLLACSLFAMVVSVACVQFWTLRTVETNGLQRAQDALAVTLAMLKHDLAPLGDTWNAPSGGPLALGATPLNGRNDIVDAIRDISGAAVTIFQDDTRIATNVKNPDGSRAIGTKLAAGPIHDAVLRDGRRYEGPATILGAPYLAVYEPIRDAQARTIGILFVGVPIAKAQAFMSQIIHETTVSTLVIVLLVALGYFGVLRITVRPLTALASVMRTIAAGTLDPAVPYCHRIDQIGEMARALAVLRDTSAHNRILESQAADSRAVAEAEKRAALAGMADGIETETGAALDRIRQRSVALTATADAMSASADRTGAAAATAGGAAGQAAANVRSIAGAAEHLTASIREISDRMSQSTAVVGRAITAGGETRAAIEALSNEVERIGSVAEMIGEIAAKTNLLALNATIEAARAGDAGKGFAVVASEVKALATQTARSTQEISRHIDQVRMATGASVAAVARIEATIAEVNGIAASIAAAVEQQGAATADIARTVTRTAYAANEMTARINDVSAEGSGFGGQAMEVRENAVRLNDAMEELHQSVVRVVRASARW